MRTQQVVYRNQEWEVLSTPTDFSADSAQLVLAFGERHCLEECLPYAFLREKYPQAEIVINSTAGEIYNDTVNDYTIIVTAIQFQKTQVKAVQYQIQDHYESGSVGEKIGKELAADDLAAILLISDGSRVNGSALLVSLNAQVKENTSISGGLAGDEARFEKTLVGLNQEAEPGNVVGIGLYGYSLTVGHGTNGGWDVFGPEREVTHSEYNTLFSIGDIAALDLYKEYLGRFAAELPAGALLFPLSMRTSLDAEPVVRTILTIDEEKKSMTFAGDVPKGALVRFMKANFDRLIEASSSAASSSIRNFENPPQLTLLISCVGRKLVLGQRTEEEVEAVREMVGPETVITGFYSYGEISRLNPSVSCELHNQTMTITTFSEY
ncbi:FIST signal transduction protein [Arundinibacter roseus]|uniref:Histidine kinase n=1 Tax=Arundinibacter roseus TaxID=2070510 RepID=A0A4R4KC58_9BACT|nr:FIST N-terminal domain-containing protein [Arundinibacter roseus]TDB65233.1 histidine kinase [Arundinibacter roseus]